MLHIIGDIDLTEGYFDKGLGIGNSLVDKKEDPFEYLSRRDDDLWIGNFECVCSDVQATGSPFIINPCHLEQGKLERYFGKLEVVTMFITYLYTFVNNGIIVSKSPLSVNFYNFRYFQTTIRKLFPKLKCHYW